MLIDVLNQEKWLSVVVKTSWTFVSSSSAECRYQRHCFRLQITRCAGLSWWGEMSWVMMMEAWDSPDCLQWLVRMMDVLDSLITECGDHNDVTIPPLTNVRVTDLLWLQWGTFLWWEINNSDNCRCLLLWIEMLTVSSYRSAKSFCVGDPI